MENKKTTSIREYSKTWGIGEATMRRIVHENPDFPCLRIGVGNDKRRQKVLILTEDADLWIKRNLR